PQSLRSLARSRTVGHPRRELARPLDSNTHTRVVSVIGARCKKAGARLWHTLRSVPLGSAAPLLSLRDDWAHLGGVLPKSCQGCFRWGEATDPSSVAVLSG